ncbi:hypothetical protein EJ06DRAFT_582999 [Trichodelitschia bisporula]|uniref:Uncharacterized protein n=1 Tax=Trichodelitschia bisporula TaxID=703511 RepID=A0A6G1HSL6_9PEZI|nr:hypothetical protein EJ06DRAFT_582999 [Trichodelitschia bisporula]
MYLKYNILYACGHRATTATRRMSQPSPAYSFPHADEGARVSGIRCSRTIACTRLAPTFKVVSDDEPTFSAPNSGASPQPTQSSTTAPLMPPSRSSLRGGRPQLDKRWDTITVIPRSPGDMKENTLLEFAIAGESSPL